MQCSIRAGDFGQTRIFGCKLDKYDERIEAIGTIDELNAFLGAAHSFAGRSLTKRILSEVQNDLFTLGAELAQAQSGQGKIAITQTHVRRIEAFAEMIHRKIPAVNKFIIPQGTKAAVLLNLSRTVARRAERSAAKLNSVSTLNPHILSYCNRLSALLYVLSRMENLGNEEKNPKYHPLRKQQ